MFRDAKTQKTCTECNSTFIIEMFDIEDEEVTVIEYCPFCGEKIYDEEYDFDDEENEDLDDYRNYD